MSEREGYRGTCICKMLCISRLKRKIGVAVLELQEDGRCWLKFTFWLWENAVLTRFGRESVCVQHFQMSISLGKFTLCCVGLLTQ